MNTGLQYGNLTVSNTKRFWLNDSWHCLECVFQICCSLCFPLWLFAQCISSSRRHLTHADSPAPVRWEHTFSLSGGNLYIIFPIFSSSVFFVPFSTIQQNTKFNTNQLMWDSCWFINLLLKSVTEEETRFVCQGGKWFCCNGIGFKIKWHLVFICIILYCQMPGQMLNEQLLTLIHFIWSGSQCLSSKISRLSDRGGGIALVFTPVRQSGYYQHPFAACWELGQHVI